MGPHMSRSCTHVRLLNSMFVGVTRTRGRSSTYSMPDTSRQMRCTNDSYSDRLIAGTWPDTSSADGNTKKPRGRRDTLRRHATRGPGPCRHRGPQARRARRIIERRRRSTLVEQDRNARTSSSNSADTGRWSLMVMVAWLVYDRCFTVTASDAMCRIRSVQAGLRLDGRDWAQHIRSAHMYTHFMS